MASLILFVTLSLASRAFLIGGALAVVQGIVAAAAAAPPFRTHFADTLNNFFTLAGRTGFPGCFRHGTLLLLNMEVPGMIVSIRPVKPVCLSLQHRYNLSVFQAAIRAAAGST